MGRRGRSKRQGYYTWYIGLTVPTYQRLFRVEGPGFLGLKYVGGTDKGLRLG